jgi:hypothetical protein
MIHEHRKRRQSCELIAKAFAVDEYSGTASLLEPALRLMTNVASSF